ncbi:MAG: hypothetical protein HYU64_14670, partial [Armatimonadetes bacterium]|nr:hypothetical protein [Armatimonadota bacterium]
LVLVMLIYFSVKISILSDQIKNLSQYIAFHRKEFDDQVKRDSVRS